MPFIKIDEKEFEVAKGTTVLQAALANGIEIPHYCYHPALEIAGSCRMCLVQIEGMPKLQVSCNTFISDVPPERKVDGKYDMVVHTKNKLVIKNIDVPQLGVRGRNSDNTLIKEELGWSPTQPLKVGIKKAYSWINKQVGK